jgi:uncharacterized protein (TIGR02996 family)
MAPTTDAEFVDAIIASPEDESIRLAYAEWLEEHPGNLNSERAEFLRLQCRIKAMSAKDEAYWALQNRLMQLEHAHNDDAWRVWVNQDLTIPSGLNEKGRLAAMTILKVLAAENSSWTGGCRLLWTPQEWQQKGWKLNEDCVVLVVVHDGPMHVFFTPRSSGEWPLHDKMDTALRKQGMFAEPYDEGHSHIVDEERF